MSEFSVLEMDLGNNGHGKIEIAPEVIEVIAGIAASEAARADGEAGNRGPQSQASGVSIRSPGPGQPGTKPRSDIDGEDKRRGNPCSGTRSWPLVTSGKSRRPGPR